MFDRVFEHTRGACDWHQDEGRVHGFTVAIVPVDLVRKNVVGSGPTVVNVIRTREEVWYYRRRCPSTSWVTKLGRLSCNGLLI